MRVVYRPALRSAMAPGKTGRASFARAPSASKVEMPTAEELDTPLVGAQKMQQIMQDREAFSRLCHQNDREIRQLETQLRTQRDAPNDPSKSRTSQMQARAQQISEVSDQLKQMARQQRALTERIANDEAMLREYGMTDEELGLTPK